MTTEAMTPQDFAFIIPEDWYRIQVDEPRARRHDIDRLVSLLVQHRPDVDSLAPQVRTFLDDAVSAYCDQTTVEIYLSMLTVETAPIGCSLVVNVVTGPPYDDPVAACTLFLTAVGTDALESGSLDIEGARVPWVRRRTVADVDGTHRFETEVVQYLFVVPEANSGVLLSFSTPQLALVERCARSSKLSRSPFDGCGDVSETTVKPVKSVKSWSYIVDFPDDGWIWMPKSEDSIATWAEEVCDDLYASEPGRSDLADQLRTCAASWRQRGDDLGAIWVPDPEYGVLATLTARLVGGPLGEFTLDAVAEGWRAGADASLGEPAISRVQLPAGAALRVRRLEPAGRTWSGDLVSEVVAHVVVPGDLVDGFGQPAGVELLMTWTLVYEGDELAQLADDVAALLRIERD